jgi:hypothetical protein
VLQNPVFNGYAGIAAHQPSQNISIVIENTHGRLGRRPHRQPSE